MKIDDEELRRAFRTAFDYAQSHRDVPNTGEDWERAAHDLGAASDAAGNGVVVMNLLIGYYRALEDYANVRG